MKTDIVTLCEYASEHDGRLTIVDAFDTIFAMKLPWRAYFYIVAKIRLDEEILHYNKIKLSIVKVGDDEKTLFNAENSFGNQKNMKSINIVAGLKGLIFETAGNYAFNVFFDERLIVKHPFIVAEKNK